MNYSIKVGCLSDSVIYLELDTATLVLAQRVLVLSHTYCVIETMLYEAETS